MIETNMGSTSGGDSGADAHTARSAFYNRTSSSTRSITIHPTEHLQTIESGIPTHDWDNIKQFQPSVWVTRNDSIKGQYAGSVADEGVTKSLKRGVGVHDYGKVDVWRAAVVELVATAGFTFLSITVYQQGSSGSVASRAFLQSIIYSLAILAAAPISGGHLNPSITLTTFLTGHASLIRSFLYIVAQCGGAVGGAAAFQFLTTQAVQTQNSMGGCRLQALPIEGVAMAATTLTNKQGLVAETIFTIIMLFVVYGIGFDTRSVVVTFPILVPFIIGGVFGVLIFLSQGLGYTATMNPARCLGPAVIYRRDLWDHLCTFTVGPLIAAAVVGIFQLLVQQANNNAEEGPVLPLTFFQAVVPDHQRPGFGPRSPTVIYPTEDNIPHSPHAEHRRPNSSELFQPSSDLNPASKYSLNLQIKAFMQQKGAESRRANLVDVARFEQSHMLQQYSNSHGSSDSVEVHHTGHPDKDR